jgi:hypothetical protein
MPCIIVGGVIANKLRNGGAAWTRLSWVLGLRKLGVDVHLVEQIDPAHCVDAHGQGTSFADSANRAYFAQIAEQFGLVDAATLIYGRGEQTHGRSYMELLDLAECADLLINISGHLSLKSLMRRIRRKAYIDLDPGFTQFWHASGTAVAGLGEHDLYFSVGANVGTPGCTIPTGDIHWRAIRQPVLLEQWPVVASGPERGFSTIASWRGPYGPIEAGGQRLGLKVHEFRKVVELPRHVPYPFEIALDIHPADARDQTALVQSGWRILAASEVVADPDSFRHYVQASSAEFSVAQGMYVATASGWFSDRTVRYLASGKPVLVQDTGFGRSYPVGEGLIAFRTYREAVDGAERIMRDYQRHCVAAREIAEQYFNSDVVLGRLLEDIGFGE